MEISLDDSHGLFEYDAFIALTRDELRQLRFAASLAQVHSDQPIFRDFLDLTDDFAL